MLIELRRRHYPPPLGHDRRGTAEGIESLTAEDHPRPLPAAVPAARHDPVGGRQHRLGAAARPGGRLFGDWKGGAEPTLTAGPRRRRQRPPRQGDRRRRRSASPTPACRSATPTTTPPRGRSTSCRGGMSARLFTEVREKRGLCYCRLGQLPDVQGPGQRHLLRRHHQRARPGNPGRDLGELQRLPEGIEPEEVERVQAGLKSSLIMQEESTSARAGALASDWYYLGRVRSFDEIQAAINAPDARGHRRPPAPLSAARLHHRHPGPQAADV